jgi:rsbT antagonist protein RsbS
VASVPILRQRGYLIATLQAAITDHEAEQLQAELMGQVTSYRARGVIIDVTVLDVLDSFAARTLRIIAHTTRLRGAHTVLVGVQPEVAWAMVRLGVSMEQVHTALDLEEGLTFLDTLLRH